MYVPLSGAITGTHIIRCAGEPRMQAMIVVHCSCTAWRIRRHPLTMSEFSALESMSQLSRSKRGQGCKCGVDPTQPQRHPWLCLQLEKTGRAGLAVGTSDRVLMGRWDGGRLWGKNSWLRSQPGRTRNPSCQVRHLETPWRLVGSLADAYIVSVNR
ncbi:hypothetical protein VTI28DRAFT_3431 [Corynascus sepedonium]